MRSFYENETRKQLYKVKYNRIEEVGQISGCYESVGGYDHVHMYDRNQIRITITIEIRIGRRMSNSFSQEVLEENAIV